MYRKKLLIVTIALMAALVTLITQGSLAYYSVFGEATSVVTSGEIDIRIVERLGENEPDDEGIYIMPGRIIAKEYSVENIGTNPCWVRIKLTNGIDDEALSSDIFEIEFNETNWLNGEDGYFYYKTVLLPDTETEYLFSQIKISGKTDNRYLGKIAKLTVAAFAVQSQNNDGYESPLDVAGWPAEN